MKGLHTRTALIYLVVGALWILVTDFLVGRYATTVQEYSRYEMIKGWVFIVVTAGLLYLLLRNALTARERYQSRLESQRELLDIALRGADLGLWIYYPRTRAIQYNERWLSMLGYSAEDVGSHVEGWRAIVHPDDLPRAQQALFDHVEGRTPFYESEYRVLTKEGEVRWILARGRVVERDPQGEPVRVAGTHHDITEHRTLQRQFSQAQRMEVVGRLAGGLAHDFNNLLTGIIGHAELARLGREDDRELQQELEDLQTTADRASELTRKLLAFGRRQLMQPKTMDLVRVVADLRSLIQRLVPDSIRVDVTLPEEPVTVYADPSALEQIVLNLVVNARDAMPRGGELSLVLEPCDPEEIADDDVFRDGVITDVPWICLRVRDTGTGIPEDIREKVFDPFFTTKEEGMGTGLGLATVYGLVKEAGGRIGFETAAGQGTRFTVALPVQEGAEPEGRRSAVDVHKLEGSEAVLVVENEEAVRSLVSRTLKQYGYRPLEADSAEEARRILERDGGDIHIVFTDVVLPGESGLSFGEELAARSPDLPVVYTTGHALPAGPVSHSDMHILPKPFTPQQLLKALRGLLDRGA